MKIARYRYDDQVQFGLVGQQGQRQMVIPLASHPFGPLTPAPDATPVPLAQVKLLAPVLPSKVIGVGRNYAEHAQEMGNEVPKTPLLFLKPSTAVIGPDEPILLPALSERVEYEAELAVVIGRLCKDVPAQRAADVIAGYTCANDVTARDLQKSDGQWARAKGADTFAPLGPWMVRQGDLDLLSGAATITCRVNGQVRQQGSTAQMVHSIPALIEVVSQAMTLLPGDVILTGTPAGVGPLVHGDTVSVQIEGIGTLTNPVRDPERGDQPQNGQAGDQMGDEQNGNPPARTQPRLYQ